jgi:hypothetical protein
MRPDALGAVDFEFHHHFPIARHCNRLDVSSTPANATTECACHLRPDWEAHVGIFDVHSLLLLWPFATNYPAVAMLPGKRVRECKIGQDMTVRRASCQVTSCTLVLVQQ